MNVDGGRGKRAIQGVRFGYGQGSGCLDVEGRENE